MAGKHIVRVASLDDKFLRRYVTARYVVATDLDDKFLRRYVDLDKVDALAVAVGRQHARVDAAIPRAHHVAPLAGG